MKRSLNFRKGQAIKNIRSRIWLNCVIQLKSQSKLKNNEVTRPLTSWYSKMHTQYNHKLSTQKKWARMLLDRQRQTILLTDSEIKLILVKTLNKNFLSMLDYNDNFYLCYFLIWNFTYNWKICKQYFLDYLLFTQFVCQSKEPKA